MNYDYLYLYGIRVPIQLILLLYFVKEVNPYTHLKILLTRDKEIINIDLLLQSVSVSINWPYAYILNKINGYFWKFVWFFTFFCITNYLKNEFLRF